MEIVCGGSYLTKWRRHIVVTNAEEYKEGDEGKEEEEEDEGEGSGNRKEKFGNSGHEKG